MLAQERQNEIIEILLHNSGVVKISDIVKRFDVSHETARRDLEALQDQNLVKRVYGGAVLIERRGLTDMPTKVGQPDHSHTEQVAIGKAAAELIAEGDSILLSPGSTVLEVARNIKHLNNLTVLTSSLEIANELTNTKFDIFVLGGKLDVNELNMTGYIGFKALQSFYVDKAFIGAGGITLKNGVSNYSYNDATLREEMLNHANKNILVAHSEIFGSNAFSFSFPLNRLDAIISDTNLSEEYVNGIKELGIELILAKP